MENTVACTDRSFSILEGVPRQADARLEIPEFIRVECLTGAGPNLSEGKGRLTARIGKQVRKVVIYLERNTEIFPTHPARESEVRPEFPCVLGIGAPFTLAETAEVV